MDKIIEKIIYMIFEEEVELDNPTETIEQIKSKLYNEGMYSYKQNEPDDNLSYEDMIKFAHHAVTGE